MRHRVLGLVPARGGSKGIPRKNARKVGPKYLLQYTSDTAHEADCFANLVLSTEDDEIAHIGEECGLEVLFMRPAELAADNTPMLDVVQHAVSTLEQMSKTFDAVCLLQPTSPLRSATTIKRCIEKLFTSDADSVVSLSPVPVEFNPHWAYFRDDRDFIHIATGEKYPISARQFLPPAFHRDGNVFVVRTSVLLRENSLYGARTIGVVSPQQEVLDLDTPEQWAQLEEIMRSRSVKS